MYSYKWGYSADLFSFKESDWTFFMIKILTLIICFPWPLTLVASVMSLAGHIPQGTPYYQIILARLFSVGLLLYPIVFFLVIKFAERLVAPRMYLLGVFIALIPIMSSSYLIYTLLFKVKK